MRSVLRISAFYYEKKFQSGAFLREISQHRKSWHHMQRVSLTEAISQSWCLFCLQKPIYSFPHHLSSRLSVYAQCWIRRFVTSDARRGPYIAGRMLLLGLVNSRRFLSRWFLAHTSPSVFALDLFVDSELPTLVWLLQPSLSHDHL